MNVALVFVVVSREFEQASFDLKSATDLEFFQDRYSLIVLSPNLGIDICYAFLERLQLNDQAVGVM